MKIEDRQKRVERTESTKHSKNKFLWGLAAIPLLLVALLTWGLIEPYTLEAEEEEAVIPSLPSAWEGKKIAQLSDFQVGMWWDNVETVAKSVDKVIEEQPAALMITGDFIYHANPNPQPQINEVVELLRPLADANIPTYAVLGNHDYGMSSKKVEPDTEQAAQLERGLESIGIQVLKNEAAIIPSQDLESDLHVVGVGSHWANNDRVDTALAQIPTDSPRIAILHNPDSFTDFPANAAPLAIAGHTHGGQIRLPLLPDWSWLSFAKEDEVVADKWVEQDYGQPGNKMYVNRGIGFSDVPIRIRCAPEITFFTLKSKSS
ncbi:MAG: metallophosphoesterase [Cyanobacteria bacterium P01_G01_bin.19]